MTRAILVAFGIALSLGTVLAQPAPPVPKPDVGSRKPVVEEKADTTENLQTGGTERPWAKGVPQDRQTAALRLFQEGNMQLNDGIFKGAVEKYREALKSWEHPAIQYNMALALMNLDQPIEVEESLTRSVRFGAAPLEKDKFEHAKEYLLLNAKQLATIEISCQKDGAKVQVDGKEVFTVKTGEPNTYRARVRIGKHTFYAEKPGYVTGLDAPFIGPNETFRIELKLYTSEELTRYKRRWSKKWMPYVVIGSGVLVGVVGGALQLSAKSGYDDYDAEVARCNEATGMNGGCAISPAVTDLRDSAETKRTLGYVGYGVAGAVVLTGALLVYLNRETTYQISSDQYRKEQMDKQRNVAVTPIVAPGFAGAMLRSRF